MYGMKKQLVIALCLFLNLTQLGMGQDTRDPAQLLGRVNVKLLQGSQRFGWFSASYSNYTCNASAIAQLTKQGSEISIFAFVGTWNAATQELLGPLYKVIDEAKINRNSVLLYFLDRDKKSPQGFEGTYMLSDVPTFIVFKNNQEIGRISGTVANSIEGDLADILLH